MANLTVNTTSRDGVSLGAAAANGGGDAFANSTGDVIFQIINANANTVNVTFATTKTVDGLAVADKTVSVNTNTTFLIGPFPADTYNDGNNLVQVTYSEVGSVTVAAFRKGS